MVESCRYCHDPATPDMPLISPCTCTGSLACVHAACLEQWVLAKSVYGRDDGGICELCHTPYATRAAPTRRVVIRGCQEVLHDASSSPSFHATVNMLALALLSLFPWNCHAVVTAATLLLLSLAMFACLCYKVSVGSAYLGRNQLDIVVFLKNIYFVFFCSGAIVVFFLVWYFQWIWTQDRDGGLCVSCTMCTLPLYSVFAIILATRIRLHENDEGIARCMTYFTYFYDSAEESCPCSDFNVRSCCIGQYVAHGQVLILVVRAFLPGDMNIDAMYGCVWSIFQLFLFVFLIIKGGPARSAFTPSHVRSEVVAQCLWFSVAASQISLILCWHHVFLHQDPPWQTDPFPIVWVSIWSVQAALTCSIQLTLYATQWISFLQSVVRQCTSSFRNRKEFTSRDSVSSSRPDGSTLHQALVEQSETST